MGAGKGAKDDAASKKKNVRKKAIASLFMKKGGASC